MSEHDEYDERDPEQGRHALLTDDDADHTDDGDVEGAEETAAPASRRGGSRRADRPGFVRRHKALTVMVGLLSLVLIAVAAAGLYLNRQIDSIPRVQLNLPQQDRPAVGKGMNILLAGADNGDDGKQTIAQAMAKGKWQPGSHRSDTIILLHLTADRKHAYLVSIPRDTYVRIDGYGMQKVNAAFSYGGPSLFVHTMEQFTQLRMNHLAIIDWNGFRDLSTALGGVRVYVAQDSYDSARDTHWKKGWQTIQGNRALSYVRQRHGLPNGDFDRIRRQQNFLRAALAQSASRGSLTNPVRFRNLLTAITGNLTVDSGLSNGEIRDLAWSLRHLRPKDLTFIQLPFGRFADTSVGSVVIPKESQTRELFSDVATDDLDVYVQEHGSGEVLSGPTDVD